MATQDKRSMSELNAGLAWRRLRGLGLLLIDSVLIVTAVSLSYLIRFDGHVPDSLLKGIHFVVFAWVLVRVAWLILHRFYSQLWEYASIRELMVATFAVTSGSITLYCANVLLTDPVGLPHVPRSIFIVEWFLTLVLLGGSRLLIRIQHDRRAVEGGPASRALTCGPSGPKRLLIVGAGDAGVMAVKEISRTASWEVVGFIDDDLSKWGRRISGIPVLGGRDSISSVVLHSNVDEILVAMPSAPQEAIREIVSMAQLTGKKIRTLPALHELIDGRVSVNQIREVRIEDLLGREAVQTDIESIAAYLKGRVVLVTGAGGSIGSELCRQVIKFSPSTLILLGHGENSIFEIDVELRNGFPNANIIPVIADVQDLTKLERVFSQFSPAVVFHAAAHKHVPLMELYPDEAIKNNVFGTLNVARLAKRNGAKKFVLVSTDKAVNPKSVMGMTKRLAEMVVESLNGGETAFIAVRFGNVLGSRGSVVPVFRKQIARGGPVTVTHPEMTRYFMTIPEAAELVIQAGALGTGQELFILDMGEPVKIVDLAQNLIRSSGLQPNVDIQVVFSGVRPGEKLHEELWTSEEQQTATCHKRIFVAKPTQFNTQELFNGVDELRRLVPSNNTSELKSKLADLVRLGSEALADREAAATKER